jgi:thymidine phosphorylase
MLSLSGAVPAAEAAARAAGALESGAAWERFLRLVQAQGGDPTSVERAGRLPRAPVVRAATAPRTGVLEAVDTFALGELVVAIGGGRRAKEDEVDPRVGLVVGRRIGDQVAAGDMLVELHLAQENPGAIERARGCFHISDGPVQAPELVLERVD